MALTPETSAALKDALDAVISECGDHPEYAHLVEALQAAEAAIPHSEGHAPEHGHETPAEDAADTAPESPAEDASADDMFAAAEAKHKDASKKKRAAAGGHDNPFADKADA